MERDFLRLLPMTSIPTYYQELHGGAAGNDYSQECTISYWYSKLDAQALEQGTLGKVVQGEPYDCLHIQRSESEVTRFSFDILHDKLAKRRERYQLEAERDRRYTTSVPPSPRDTNLERKKSDGGEKRGFFSRKGRSFFSLSPKKPPSVSSILMPLPTFALVPGGGGGCTCSFPVTWALFLQPVPRPSGKSSPQPDASRIQSSPSTKANYMYEAPTRGLNAPQDEEARLLQQRTLHYLHRHLRRFCPTASSEQCLDWANDYHNCQFLQSTEIFRLMISVRTSPATVAATSASVRNRDALLENGMPAVRLTKSTLKAAFEGIPDGTASFKHVSPAPSLGDMSNDSGMQDELENEKVLFRLMEKTYAVLQEISFPFPQGFHHRFVTLAYRTLPRPLFKQYLATRVLRVTEEFVMRTLEELSGKESKKENQFKFFLVSQLDGDALARAFKKWPHPECRRFLADATVTSILADAADDAGQEVDDEEDETIFTQANMTVFPPLRSFMRTLSKKEAVANW